MNALDKTEALHWGKPSLGSEGQNSGGINANGKGEKKQVRPSCGAHFTQAAYLAHSPRCFQSLTRGQRCCWLSLCHHQ